MSKGISSHLLKASAKRRRSKAQIKDEKQAEERKQQEIIRKLAAYDQMEQRVKETESIHEEKENYRQLCESLYVGGVIKQEADGTFVAVEDPAERESIRSKSHR